MVDRPAFAAGVVVGPAEPPPWMGLGVGAQPAPQPGIGVGRGLVTGRAALRATVLPSHATGEPLTDPEHAHQVVNGRPPACRAQNSPLAISLSAAFSSSASASSRLRVEFSFSNSFSRLASSAFNPPNWLRHR